MPPGMAHRRRGLGPEVPSEGKPTTIGELIDSMPLGRFHALHVTRQILLNAIFALSLEIPPYVFPGMSREFDLDVAQESYFPAAFFGGAILGALCTSLQDSYGRRPVIRYGAIASLVLTLLQLPMRWFWPVLALRACLGVAFVSMQYGFSAWFAELLPTHNRGPLYVALTAGYPLGRATVISVSSILLPAEWRLLLATSAAGLAVALLLAWGIEESPRYLAVSGDDAGACDALRAIYEFNRTPLPPALLPLPPAAAPEPAGKRAAGEETGLLESGARRKGQNSAEAVMAEVSDQYGGLVARWTRVRNSPPAGLRFALGLFSGVGIQQCLITNWGPRVFQRLIYPTATSLPFGVLMVFNAADFGGIAFSLSLIDRLGRRGFFIVGFVLAALLWLALGLIPVFTSSMDDKPDEGSLTTLLIVVGALASATRGFAPEASNLWVLETFPTDQRATCYAASNVAYQASNVLWVPLSGLAVEAVDYEPTTLLVGYAVIQLLLGVYAAWLPRETVNVGLGDRST